MCGERRGEKIMERERERSQVKWISKYLVACKNKGKKVSVMIQSRYAKCGVIERQSQWNNDKKSILMLARSALEFIQRSYH